MSKYRNNNERTFRKSLQRRHHQDVSSSKRMCKTIVEDAQQIETKLNSMSLEDSLDTWWTNKLAVSANNLNKGSRDYIVNDVKEELELVFRNNENYRSTMFEKVDKSELVISKVL